MPIITRFANIGVPDIAVGSGGEFHIVWSEFGFGWGEIYYARMSGGPTPFLDLPFSYSNFAQSALGNVGGKGPGRVNSWFDHFYPNYTKNQNLFRWDGAIFVGTKTYVENCKPGLGEYCYDGHNGIDFQSSSTNEQVFAAAPGTVIQIVTTCQQGAKYANCGGDYGNQVWIKHKM